MFRGVRKPKGGSRICLSWGRTGGRGRPVLGRSRASHREPSALWSLSRLPGPHLLVVIHHRSLSRRRDSSSSRVAGSKRPSKTDLGEGEASPTPALSPAARYPHIQDKQLGFPGFCDFPEDVTAASLNGEGKRPVIHPKRLLLQNLGSGMTSKKWFAPNL